MDMKSNDGNRYTAEEMDVIRQKNMAYEYLCHLEEAKKWLEAVLKETLPVCTELEENLRNGVILGKLANLVVPEVVPHSRIYDIDQHRYRQLGLQYRHTDNISHWIKSLQHIKLPATFHPETTDVYDKKNMPRVIYCIHALSTHLFKLGKAPQIQDLLGKVSFTDEEISMMSAELRKYGIQMPSFQKIGGLLAANVSGDAAALHAAVIAVNKTINARDCVKLIEALTNPFAKLESILMDYVDFYMEALSKAKNCKVETALNRSLNDSYVTDVYDELLTHAELQGHIILVNIERIWLAIMEAVSRNDSNNCMKLLLTPCLDLKGLSAANASYYLSCINELPIASQSRGTELKQEIQTIVDSANEIARSHKQSSEAVACLNHELDHGDVGSFLDSLRAPALMLNPSHISIFAAPLYFEEMKADKEDLGEPLQLSDIQASVAFLAIIADVTRALDLDCSEAMWTALSNPLLAKIMDLDGSLKVQYWHALVACKKYKMIECCGCPILTLQELQGCINLVNLQFVENNLVITRLHELNTALAKNDKEAVYKIIKDPVLKLDGSISKKDLTLLFHLLQDREAESECELWLEDIESAVGQCMAEVEEVRSEGAWLFELNNALTKGECSTTMALLALLQGPSLSEHMLTRAHAELRMCRNEKERKVYCPWLLHLTKNNHRVYVNVETADYSWDKPSDFKYNSHFLSKEEVKRIISRMSSQETHRSREAAVQQIVGLQARIRGFLVRQRNAARLDYFRKHEKEIVKIQTWWRSAMKHCIEARNRQCHTDFSTLLPLHQTAAIHMDYYVQHESKIIKIQAAWRGRQVRYNFFSLFKQENPSFNLVRHFIPFLDFNTEDYQRELELQMLRAQVVQMIRQNKVLAEKLDRMDIMIGLLVQNRITLQDVVAEGKKLSVVVNGGSRQETLSRGDGGLKCLRADRRRLLAAYQHLFYTLQTRPHYLARLLFLLPHSRTNKFLQPVILTLFNFGASQRDEYLFLKLLQYALHEEIRCKFEKPNDVVTGNPLVLQMAVNYARQRSGQNALRLILQPLIQKILNDKYISIDTNPVTIYTSLRNKMEMESGVPSELPYKVSPEQALQYEEVQKRLAASISTLKATALWFLQSITQAKSAIPYGLLFIARELRTTLATKFVTAHEKEILKVVGHLIYYMFINCAIVAPDAFDIITLPAERTLSNDHRHTLATIAKILQFAASKKGFGEESHYLMCLNPFIIDCHEKFKDFFRDCCQIEDLDTHYSMTEFTEATLIAKPTIYITLQEICETHSLLINYAEDIAPNTTDHLHELLNDLGPVPTLDQLMGSGDDDASAQKNMAHTEVCLTLTDKFEVELPQMSQDQDLTRLFIKTKELLVCVVGFLSGHTLAGALRIEPTTQQEEAFQQTQAAIHSNIGSLRECKARLRKCLAQLEVAGLVNREDGYQAIISAIARDIRNRGKYRQIQAKELQTIRNTKLCLEEKSAFYEEQIEFYNKYIETCLENLNAGKRSVHCQMKTEHARKVKSKVCLKYTAVQLKEKGILVEMEALPINQYKNIQFEISPTESNGVFSVRGKFMGVQMEKIEIDIQKLLQLQFEGVGVMDIFGKAKININLLLFLLNRKFYGK